MYPLVAGCHSPLAMYPTWLSAMATMRWGRLKPARVALFGTHKEPVFPNTACRTATRTTTTAPAPRTKLRCDRPAWRDRTALALRISGLAEKWKVAEQVEDSSYRGGGTKYGVGTGDEHETRLAGGRNPVLREVHRLPCYNPVPDPDGRLHHLGLPELATEPADSHRHRLGERVGVLVPGLLQ